MRAWWSLLVAAPLWAQPVDLEEVACAWCHFEEADAFAEGRRIRVTKVPFMSSAKPSSTTTPVASSRSSPTRPQALSRAAS